MLLLATLASAASPWECPTLTTPAEASAWRGSDLGAAEMLDTVEAEAGAVSAGCAWVVTTGEDSDGTWTESVCDTAELHVVQFESAEERDDIGWTTTTRVRSFDATWTGGGWTSLHYSETVERLAGVPESWGAGTVTREASWIGSIDDLPDDASLTRRESSYDVWSGSASQDSIDVETPTCSFAWSWGESPDMIGEGVTTAPGIQVVVNTMLVGSECPDGYVHATVDGMEQGAVDPDTWEPDLDDADRDGLVAACDCDDTDASVNAFASEVPDDGIDQNCDGVDLTDTDADGYWDTDAGGNDCDDTNAAIHPDATETPCDGVDDDCDGVDTCSDTGGDTATDTATTTDTADDTASPSPPPPDDEEAAPEADSTCSAAPGPVVMIGLLLPLLRRRRG